MEQHHKQQQKRLSSIFANVSVDAIQEFIPPRISTGPLSRLSPPPPPPPQPPPPLHPNHHIVDTNNNSLDENNHDNDDIDTDDDEDDDDDDDCSSSSAGCGVDETRSDSSLELVTTTATSTSRTRRSIPCGHRQRCCSINNDDDEEEDEEDDLLISGGCANECLSSHLDETAIYIDSTGNNCGDDHSLDTTVVHHDHHDDDETVDNMFEEYDEYGLVAYCNSAEAMNHHNNNNPDVGGVYDEDFDDLVYVESLSEQQALDLLRCESELFALQMSQAAKYGLLETQNRSSNGKYGLNRPKKSVLIN